MTLTSLLPTLRESLPAPLVRDLWPASTVPQTRDVVIAGVSLLRYVELCSTPCVTTWPAVLPQSGGIASTTDSTSVVTTRITGVSDDGCRALTVDAGLSLVDHHGSELRLIGRVSHAPDTAWIVLDANGVRVAVDAPALPADLRVGDLLALPCPGALAVGALRPAAVR